MNSKKYYSLLFYCISIFCIASCSSTRTINYTFNQKYAAAALKEDVILLKKMLEANHPSLYWYTPKDSIDYYFNTIINSITDSLTEVQFRNKVAYAVSKIRCGHTSVRFSKQYTKLVSKHLFPIFPLGIKAWKDSMVILSNVFIRDSILKRGTVITAINGRNVKTLTDSMFQFIGNDGFSTNYKSQVISSNFATWYKNVFGLSSSYTINYINSKGNEQTTILKNFTPKRDSTIKKDSIVRPIIPVVKTTRKSRLLQKRSLQIDTTLSTAYMRLTTFGKAKTKKFFRQSFKKIEAVKSKNLIIDLRENGGGEVDNYVKLTQYIKDTSFKVGDSISAITRRLKYKKYIHPGLFQWLNLNFSTVKKPDGRYHQRREETHYFNIKQNHHFNGNVFLITGGLTYSAAAMFTTALKGQKNVTVVGEETGGGNYGNSAMQIPDIILPHSHLQVRLPLFRTVINANAAKDGRGILPDIEVPPSSIAIKQGIDPKLITIKKIIAGNNKPSN